VGGAHGLRSCFLSQGGSGASVDETTRQEMLSLLPRLRRFAYALTGSSDAGDELVQATYERAIRHIDKWQPGSRLDSWMFRIARNLNLNLVRDQKLRGPSIDPSAADLLTSVDGQRSAEARLTLEKVRSHINLLPEDQRSIVLLICVEGLSYAEVSRILDMPIGTIASRLGRLRLRLKAIAEGRDQDARSERKADKA